jgi:hypothetical protein
MYISVYMDRIKLKSDADMAETKLPVRTTIKFSRLLRTQSNLIYPDKNDPRESASRMLIQAAIDKLVEKGKFTRSFLNSIC